MHVLLAAAEPLRAPLLDELTALGHEVSVAGDGDHALALIAKERPSLVVVEVDLPGVSGLDVCRRVRESDGERSRTFVLVLTDDELPGRLAAVLDAGADDFILTAARPEGLRARIAARAAIAVRRIAEDDARRRAEAALARTQRLLGIDEASAALQHEINNPLAALLAHASLLEHGLHDPGEERELLGVIVEQAHRIADVVKRIAALRYADGEEYVPND
jgi:DNA-binding response OmpR family regulator